MLRLLRDYIEDDKRIIEYTRDGETVSHRIIESLKDTVEEDEEIIIPGNPINKLREENQELKNHVSVLGDTVDMLMQMTMGGM